MNFWIDAAMLAAFIAVAYTGFMLWFFIPGGYQGGRNASYATENLFVNRQFNTALHDWSGLALTIAIALHLALHFSWVKGMATGFFRQKRKKPR